MRVWVTRDEPAGGLLGTALQAAGLEPVWEPVLHRRITADAHEEIARLGSDDWLVLTSAFAVTAVTGQPVHLPQPLPESKPASRTAESPTHPHDATRTSPPPCRAKVAVVGQATEKAARSAGFSVALVASGQSGRSLFADLRATMKSGTICYPRSALASAPGPWPGVTIISPAVYETAPRAYDRTVIRRVDLITVASPSAVEAIGPLDLPFASIGPTTSEALRKIGRPPWIEAPDPSFASLAQAIAGTGRQ